MLLPIIRWWFSLTLISVLALPLTLWLFQRLPGRGLAWSRALGLLIVGYVAWLSAMFGFTSFNTAAIILGCSVLAGLSWLVSRRSGGELWEAFWQRRWAWLGYEALWMLGLAAGIWLRFNGGVGPGIHHTEKPMELMLLNSVISSPTYPPQDLWLSGYAVNYYYLGYVFVAVLKVLSGVGLGEAFNLGVATILALAAQGVAGCVGELVMLAQRLHERRNRFGPVAAAVLGVVLVLFTGNQLGALQRITGTSNLNFLNDSQRIRVLKQALSGIKPLTLSTDDPATITGNRTYIELDQMATFDWWAPSRAVYDIVERDSIIILNNVEAKDDLLAEDITEFPYFSFYLGDMHPHVLALPWVLLVLGLALNLAAANSPPRWRSREGGIELGITGLAIGSLYAVNSWDAPTYGMLYAGVMLLVVRRSHSHRTGRIWLQAIIRFSAVVGVAIVLYLPFLVTFVSFAGNTTFPDQVPNNPLIRAIGGIIGPAQDHSSWSDLVIIFGVFLVPLAAWWANYAPQISTRLEHFWTWAIILLLGLAGLTWGFPTLGFLPLAFFLWRSAWRNADQMPRAFVLHTSALAVLALVAVDFIYLRDQFDRRINTIFKVYYQVWILLGILAAFAAWHLLANRGWRRVTTALWLPLFALLVVGGLMYPISTLEPEKVGRWSSVEEPHLDGLIDSSHFTADKRTIADWIRNNTPADAILVSHAGDSYGVGGEIAALSGRATILAWPGSHENLWRSKQPEAHTSIGTRLSDIARIYTSPDATEVQEIIKRYNADYVIFGPNETQIAGANTTVLNQIGVLVFEYNGWAIYQIRSS